MGRYTDWINPEGRSCYYDCRCHSISVRGWPRGPLCADCADTDTEEATE